ncbi:hypothetical protein K3169_25380 [Pseudomonas phytophila]|uniref:Uncharacterized protein n=1 Tax=Pseudomonas phytophila TaxID=2867264 RepID=A0ABY6FCK7_9PSED|nr:hypothetical protein [Pseudomonas phytophila]UXZ95612.1 hypothetical protein K3169_25380 [Pseudomonas phytophila]
MKRTALTGLFLTAALLGSPAFAADDLCGANLQALKDAHTSANANMSADTKAEIEKTQADALKAQKAGDEEKCVELTTNTITKLKNTGSASEGAK